LLAVEQELHHAGGKWPLTTVRGRLRFGGPHEQAAHGPAQVERSEQFPDLVAVPDIAALEFWQGYVPAVDVVEYGGNLHADTYASDGAESIQ
jgi:hypothetical protein